MRAEFRSDSPARSLWPERKDFLAERVSLQATPTDRSREIPVMQLRSLPHRLLLATGATLLVVAPLSAGLAVATPNPTGTTWTGGKPLPPAPGLGLHRNEDGEPGMGVTPTGQFWIASDIAPYAADDP